jgi:hypothetical protein
MEAKEAGERKAVLLVWLTMAVLAGAAEWAWPGWPNRVMEWISRPLFAVSDGNPAVFIALLVLSNLAMLFGGIYLLRRSRARGPEKGGS